MSADNSTPYLEDLPGIKDVRNRGGSLFPRRNVLELDGAYVTDDAVNGQTRIELRAPFTIRDINFANFPTATANLFIGPNDESECYRFVDVTDLIGLAPPGPGGRYRVWIINGDPNQTMDIENNHASAPLTSRILTATGSALTLGANGGFCMLAYIPSQSRWKVLG